MKATIGLPMWKVDMIAAWRRLSRRYHREELKLFADVAIFLATVVAGWVFVLFAFVHHS
jgi:hypothetical protein